MKFKLKLNLNDTIIKIKRVLRPITSHMQFMVFILLAMFLILGIFSVNQILQQPTDQAYLDQQQKNSVQTRFDAQTIDKVEQLKRRQENASLDLPSDKRINPFNE